MRKTIILLSLILTSTPLFAEKSTKEIYNNSKGSVVLLISYDKEGMPSSLGSGFFFEKNKIASNFHVVKGSSKITYRLIGDTKSYEVKSISSASESLDLAILDVNESFLPLNVTEIAKTDIGDKVVAIGNPRGLEGSVSEGIISAVRTTEKINIIQTTTPISPGSSGGPLFNKEGQVIGITTATRVDSQNLNFAMPASLILTLKSKGLKWEPVVKNDTSKKGTNGIELSGVKFPDYSLHNKNNYGITKLKYVIILRDPETNKPIDFFIPESTDEIPAGLAKRYQLENNHEKQKTNDRAKALGLTKQFPISMLMNPPKMELRVLTYDFIEAQQGDTLIDKLN